MAYICNDKSHSKTYHIEVNYFDNWKQGQATQILCKICDAASLELLQKNNCLECHKKSKTIQELRLENEQLYQRLETAKDLLRTIYNNAANYEDL